MTKDEVYELLTLLAKEDSADEVFWRVDREGVLHCSVNVNDVFYWACGDAETVTAEDFDDIRKAFADMQVIEDTVKGSHATIWATMLWVCRKRGMRPQTPVWEKLNPAVRDILLTAGPVRDRKDEG